MFSEYLNIKPERAKTNRPPGYKHLRADNEIEHILISIWLFLQRLDRAFYGGDLNE